MNWKYPITKQWSPKFQAMLDTWDMDLTKEVTCIRNNETGEISVISDVGSAAVKHFASYAEDAEIIAII